MGLFNKLKKNKEVEKKAEKPEVKVEKKVEKKEENVVEKKVAKKAVKIKGDAHKVLIKSIISEKASIAEASGVYTFMINKRSTKTDVKSAIQQVYGIVPKKVRIMNMEGKKARYGRVAGRRSDWKKALLTLSKGQSISIHEGV